VNWQDAVNAGFEVLAVAAVIASIVKVRADVRATGGITGISMWHVGYSNASAAWFTYYYAHLSQWASFTVGLAYLGAVVFWAWLLITYGRGARGT
jgi:hypothetical protein